MDLKPRAKDALTFLGQILWFFVKAALQTLALIGLVILCAWIMAAAALEK